MLVAQIVESGLSLVRAQTMDMGERTILLRLIGHMIGT